MKKPAKLLFTKLKCIETTGEKGEDELVIYIEIDNKDSFYSPSKKGRYKFKKGEEDWVGLEIDVTTVEQVFVRLIECDTSDPEANKNEVLGEFKLTRDEVLKAFDENNGEPTSDENDMYFYPGIDGSENESGRYSLYYRVITNPIPTVRVLGIRCEQQSAGYDQKAVNAMLTVAEKATKEAGKVIKKSPRPRAKVIGDAFKAASKVLKGVQEIADWIGRIIEGKNDEVYMDRVFPSRGLNGAFFPPNTNVYKMHSEQDIYFEEEYGRYFRFPLDNGPVTLELREHDGGKTDVNIGSITIDPDKIAANSHSGISSQTMTGDKNIAVMDGPAVVELADTYGKRDGEGALYHICYSVGYEDWIKDATTSAQGDPDDV